MQQLYVETKSRDQIFAYTEKNSANSHFNKFLLQVFSHLALDLNFGCVDRFDKHSNSRLFFYVQNKEVCKLLPVKSLLSKFLHTVHQCRIVPVHSVHWVKVWLDDLRYLASRVLLKTRKRKRMLFGG
jgi:hypothetical protein